MRMNSRISLLTIVCAAFAAPQERPQLFSIHPEKKEQSKATIDSLDKVWFAAHSSYPDLLRFQGRWYTAFREAEKPDSADGDIRILSSTDGKTWATSAKLDYPVADLRSPSLSINLKGEMLLTTVGLMYPNSDMRHKAMVWVSKEGRDWSSAEPVADGDTWLTDVAWHRNIEYAIGYSTTGERRLRLYLSRDGNHLQALNPDMMPGARPADASILFLSHDDGFALAQREGDATARLGRSVPPYRGWQWRDLKVSIGASRLIALPDGRIVAAVTMLGGKPGTSLCWLDTERPELTEFLHLPSAGDSGAIGLAWYNDRLWVNYASTHEGISGIYMAQVSLPEGP